MKRRCGFLPLFVFLVFCLIAPLAHADKEVLPSQVLNYAGKTYGGVQDPEYTSYDHALRDHMVKRIKQKFGVDLDPKKYSGFDLLEIESFFDCKKSDEPFDLFLKIFPKQR